MNNVLHCIQNTLSFDKQIAKTFSFVLNFNSIVDNMIKIVVKFMNNRYHYLRNRWHRKWLPMLWPKSPLNLPFKCRRYPPELTEQFLAQRSLVWDQKVDKNLYIHSYRHLIVDKSWEEVVQNILNYYNSQILWNRFMPSTITPEDMKYMINNLSHWRWKRYVDYLFVHEFDCWRTAKNTEELKAINREKEKQRMDQIKQIGCFDAEDNIQYGFWRNSLFTRDFNRSLKKCSFHRLRTATLFGQPLVIDCCFDEEMQEYEIQSVGRQLSRIYQYNRKQTADPFDIHFCNCDDNSRVMKTFKKYLSPIDDFDKYYLNFHSQSYLQLFPDQRLVYLSPDARDIMTDFEPNAIYILGALVGKTCSSPLTKMKAIDEGLECYRLPIHRYVKLNPMVKKTLAFDSCFKIMANLKVHNNWELALNEGIMDNKLKSKEID